MTANSAREVIFAYTVGERVCAKPAWGLRFAFIIESSMIVFHVRVVTHAKNMDVYSEVVGSAQNTRLAQNHAGILAILQYNARSDATNSIFVWIVRRHK